VGDDDSVRDLVALTASTYGGLDGMFFNAAQRSLLSRDTTVVDINLDDWDEIFRISLKGGVHAARHSIPEMVKRGGGSLVMTSSVAAFTASRFASRTQPRSAACTRLLVTSPARGARTASGPIASLPARCSSRTT
jgi:NAD(P)-dependent dehydrogenase (short-subunit alcohol dehydrogenase family)